MLKTNHLHKPMTYLYKMRLLVVALMTLTAIGASAQRFADELDRGIVAVNLGSQTFVSWRILGEEYYGTTYNLYKNGSLVAEGLTVSNWTGAGSATDQFTVKACTNGVWGEMSGAATPWQRYGSNQTGYLKLPLSPVVDRNGVDKTHHYWSNDAIFADLDGDGQLEFILKRINTWDADNTYPVDNTTEYVVWEAYDVDWQSGATTRMWWIDCGPNMVSLNSTENNLLAYDWDMDGRAEVVMRGADNMIFHHSDGTTETIGDPTVNTRNDFDHNSGGQYAWTKSGNEYLIYFNGQTARTYQVMEYPLKRFEDNEDPTDIDAAWHGRGQYGHISSKYFFGAPYLDGRKPSIFLARGIYTRHKMCAYDVDPATHQLTQRWEWHSTANGNTPGSYWYGNGYHNYVIADVDEDGRDEIVMGSMIIDDNGLGLNSTAFGHGDAMQINDLDPYRQGLEVYTCIEDAPTWGMAYRSGLTGEIYKHFVATGDDGRALAGNFTDAIPGSLGCSAGSDALGLSSDTYFPDYTKLFSGKNNGAKTLNFRIYWDGDLLSESMEGTGASDNGSSLMIYKWNDGTSGNDRLITTWYSNAPITGTSNNGSKNNPCFQGDILGDWREELVMRSSSGATVTEDGTDLPLFDQLVVFTSTYSSPYGIYNLWADHQYRQAMGTQMQVYNLPPNVSFFLGNMEGITVAPPPLINLGRDEIASGGTIGTAHNGKHVMLAATGNATATIAEGAQPLYFTDNASWWVQGTNASEATGLKPSNTTVYTHTVGGSLSGATNLVKQGNGVLKLTASEHTHYGVTEVWAGTLATDATFNSSPLTLHRFATLSTAGGTFEAGTKTEYGSTIAIGGESTTPSTATFTSLNLGFGSQVAFDLGGTNVGDNDQLIVGSLALESKTDDAWVTYGPKYLKPVFTFNATTALSGTRYPIGTLQALVGGDTSNAELDVAIEGINENREPHIVVENGTIYLVLNDAPTIEAPELAIIDWVNCDLTDTYPSSNANSYYLPVVGFTSEVEGATLSCTFTDLDGNVTEMNAIEAKTIMEEDFETYTGVGDWNSPNAQDHLALASDSEHGNHISFEFSNGANARSASWKFDCTGMGTAAYTIDFDAFIKPGNQPTNGPTELTVMSGASVPTNAAYGNSNFLFDIRNISTSNTTYTVNQGSQSVVIPSGVWCHYSIAIDPTAMTSTWTITNSSTNATIGSGTSNLPDGSLTTPTGIYLLGGRYNPVMKFDNLSIKTIAQPLEQYAFTEPGTLNVTVAAEGYADNMATFTVEHPYVKEELADFYANDYEEATSPSDWVNSDAVCPLTLETGDATYGNYIHHSIGTKAANRSAYTLFNSKYGSASNYTIEFDACLRAGNTADRSVTDLVVMSNGATIPTTKNAGYEYSQSNTSGTGYLFRLRAPNSQVFTINDGSETVTLGNTTWYHYTLKVDVANSKVVYDISTGGTSVANGKFTVPSGTSCLAQGLFILDGRGYGESKFDNIKVAPIPNYLPVAINDELCLDLPQGIVDGNAHLWRSNLGVSDTWATAVLPFGMSSAQVQEVFGEGTEVANLLTNAGDAESVHFETSTGEISANVPFLIRGVTNEPPYLVKGITSSPAVEPVASTPYFDFIGTYSKQGLVEFTTSDYFFTAAGLRTVAENGVKMNLNGYRAYFHSIDGSAGSVLNTFFDGVTAVKGIETVNNGPMNIYNVAGQLVRRNATSLDGLPRGVYLMGGKAIVVK